MVNSLVDNWRRFNFIKIAISCGCVFVFGILFGYALFPAMLKKMVGKSIALKPGSEIRDMYTTVPFPLTVKIYLFNIKNPVEVTKGAAPMLEEMGPYFFDEWKHKYDMVDNEEEDSLEYRMTNTFIFRPDLSNGLTGNEVITAVHPLLMGMALAVNVDKKPLLGMTATAIEHIFHAPDTPFWTGRVMDLLFDGLDVDCSSQEYAAKATCAILGSGDVAAIKVIDPEHLKFAMMSGGNATSLGVFKVHRGVRDYHDVGRMISFDDEEEMDVWGTDDCNQYHGTDSSIFPPRLKPADGLWAYEPSLCLSVGAQYVGPSNYAGISTNEYTLDFGDARKDEGLQCYCMDPPDDCPRAGTLGMFQCLGSPMVVSLPHFYKADPAILKQFAGGLRPNKEDHDVFIHYEHITGSPLSAAKRLQFSIDVVPIAEVDCMKDLPEVLMPLFWLEESVHLNDTYLKPLKNQLFLMIKIVSVIKWLCIVIGAGGCAVAAYLQTRKLNEAGAVKPVSPKKEATAGLSVVSIEEPPPISIATKLETDRNPLGPLVNGGLDKKPVSINSGFKSKY